MKTDVQKSHLIIIDIPYNLIRIESDHHIIHIYYDFIK